MYQQDLNFLQDMFLQTQNICTWCLTTDMQLVFTNCPEEEFFYNLFSVSSCRNAIQEHFSASTMPLLASDSIGFVWITSCHYNEDNKASHLYLLGPVFTSEMTSMYLQKHCQKMRLTPNITEKLLHFTKDIPTISSNTASCYAGMLHYCINNTAIKVTDVQIWNEPSSTSNDPNWGNSQWHGSWITEQRLFKSIMEGRLEDQSNINTGKIGNIGGGDPLRQAKNEIIVFAVICSRAAILGGVSSEGALNLSDYFIQLIEDANSISQVRNIGEEMLTTYVQRVQRVKANSNLSLLVRACMEYVDTHICEKIVLKDLAQEIGYNEYYISRTFKSDTGENLNDYINKRKISLAKTLLKNPGLTVAEIAEKLAFSSPSYFSTIFKKQTGITPVEYQTKGDVAK